MHEYLKMNLTSLILFHFSANRSLPFEAICTGVLTVVAFLGQKSEVEILPGFSEPMNLFSLIVGLPSTKKSHCIKLIKKEFNVMEKMMKRDDDDDDDHSHVNSSK